MLINTIIRIVLTVLVILSTNNFALAEKNLDSVIIEMKKKTPLNKLLQSAGITKEDATSAVDELSNVYNPKNIPVGQKIKINFEIMDDEGKEIRFSSMEINISPIQKIQVSRLDSDIFLAHIFESK